jgi:hypothetical protein
MDAPTFSQIKAQVAAIRKKVPGAQVIGIRSPGRWTGERLKRDGGETYFIEQCDSPLAMRLALREEGPWTTKVLVTDLNEEELSDDIRVRLAKRQLIPIDSWQIVKSLFQAQAIDPRLTRHRWIADYLMEFIPEGGYPAVPGGFLDAEIAWPILLRQVAGLNAEQPDLASILRWSIGADVVARFRSASTELREAAIEWLAGTAGLAAVDVFRCIQSNARPDALPVGLAAGVVFHPQAKGRLDKAAGKMEERFLGSSTPGDDVIARWAEAAAEVVRLQITDARLKTSLLQRADEILQEVGAESFAHLSATSPIGFTQRLARFGAELGRTLQSPDVEALQKLSRAREEIADHELASRERRRLERTDMAVRLIRWLRDAGQRPPEEARSLPDAAKGYIAEGGFIDWARLTLRLGDPVRELSEAYGKLYDATSQRREEQSKHFGELLRSWTESDSESAELTAVERILETFVAPLAAESPILLLVVDGMSIAVCRELLGDLIGHEWIPLARGDSRCLISAGLAAIPSLTEVSRTSLLCGRLAKGDFGDERIGFASHPALLGRSKEGYPPVLFHKASLRDASDAVLSAEVRAEIASSHRRIVGVVVNAVDDLLDKGEQVDTRWTRDSVPVLAALLHEAKVARRLVVVTSDHGHILEARTESRPPGGGERWRAAEGNPGPSECKLSGRRVVVPDSKTVFVPWSDQVRYGNNKKNGYHGGATPQEMVVPIVVLCPTEAPPNGWVEVNFDQPSWWAEQLPQATPSREMAPPPVLATRAPNAGKPRQTPLLFDLEENAPGVEPKVQPSEEAPAWVDQLLRSPAFADQKKLAGRSVPADEVFRSILEALDRRGGKLTSGALAVATSYPAMRLRGLLAVVQRVLNIEGYAVLTRDDASDTVELNRELLKRQFDLR